MPGARCRSLNPVTAVACFIQPEKGSLIGCIKIDDVRPIFLMFTMAFCFLLLYPTYRLPIRARTTITATINTDILTARSFRQLDLHAGLPTKFSFAIHDVTVSE
jgi:hypothetical protein